MSGTFEVRIEWLEAPGVTTPELAATWARYEIWLGGRCVTQVETADGTFRRSVYGSLYPLAHWIASNWWLLISHARPSAVDTNYWTWRNVRNYPWLAEHNFRGAGDGMAWPDLTLVPEGAISHIVWKQDYQRNSMPVRFASDGSGFVPVEELRAELAGIINHVLERLSEAGLPKTPLAEEWSEVAKADDQEQQFCRTAARMGIDPYSVDDDTAEVIVSIADQLPTEIADDFFDSADVKALADAADWTRRAMLVSERAAARAVNDLQGIYSAISVKTVTGLMTAIDSDRPWALGYAMARQLRRELEVKDTNPFDVSPWVGVGDVTAPSNGIYGFASVTEDRCGVVLGNRGLGSTATRFGLARALGRVVARPGQRRFVLSAARSHDERFARAFAAELLAPAEGIRLTLESIGKTDDSALEAVAQRFRVSPLVVRHQYDNQIAA
jgi:IrrE N-terminal-like domain